MDKLLRVILEQDLEVLKDGLARLFVFDSDVDDVVFRLEQRRVALKDLQIDLREL